MKKALILASVASMIEQFNMPNIRLLQDMGYEVDVIANFEHGSTISRQKIGELKSMLQNQGVQVIHLPIPRSIFDIAGILKSYRAVKKICMEKSYELVHCHSPIGSVIARLGAKKARKHCGTKVIYTAHGFHFYQGAPLQNWMLFYPIEKICAHYTDVLLTINNEDYAFARKHIHAGCVEYIPGIGVDLGRFQTSLADSANKKTELGLAKDSVVLLSVGELNKNKNHIAVLQAVAKLHDPKVHYCIAGQGVLKEYLLDAAKDLGIEKQLHLLGYRTDVAELYAMADIFVFPSLREGLSVSLMEAMSSGLPCVVSKIRGNVDLIQAEKGGFLCSPASAWEFAEAISKLSDDRKLRYKMGKYNKQMIREFSVEVVMDRTKEIYGR